MGEQEDAACFAGAIRGARRSENLRGYGTYAELRERVERLPTRVTVDSHWARVCRGGDTWMRAGDEGRGGEPGGKGGRTGLGHNKRVLVAGQRCALLSACGQRGRRGTLLVRVCLGSRYPVTRGHAILLALHHSMVTILPDDVKLRKFGGWRNVSFSTRERTPASSGSAPAQPSHLIKTHPTPRLPSYRLLSPSFHHRRLQLIHSLPHHCLIIHRPPCHRLAFLPCTTALPRTTAPLSPP